MLKMNLKCSFYPCELSKLCATMSDPFRDVLCNPAIKLIVMPANITQHSWSQCDESNINFPTIRYLSQTLVLS